MPPYTTHLQQSKNISSKKIHFLYPMNRGVLPRDCHEYEKQKHCSILTVIPSEKLSLQAHLKHKIAIESVSEINLKT